MHLIRFDKVMAWHHNKVSQMVLHLHITSIFFLYFFVATHNNIQKNCALFLLALVFPPFSPTLACWLFPPGESISYLRASSFCLAAAAEQTPPLSPKRRASQCGKQSVSCPRVSRIESLNTTAKNTSHNLQELQPHPQPSRFSTCSLWSAGPTSLRPFRGEKGFFRASAAAAAGQPRAGEASTGLTRRFTS